MAYLSGLFSLWDERSWGLDSDYRSGLYRVETGSVSFGELGSVDFDDWYSLRLPGSGTYRLTVSNDSANNYSGNTWSTSLYGVQIQITNAYGLVDYTIGSATAFGSADAWLQITYNGAASTSDFYVKVSNVGIASVDYALKLALVAAAPINGTSGNDTLWGTTANDSIYGLAGDDTLFGDLGNDYLDGGTGEDVASYVVAPSSVTVNLSTGSSSGGYGVDTLVSIEDVYGSDFADSITGDGGPNYLAGGGGNDSIYGLGGDDILVGGLDHDYLYGGSGDDWLFGGAGNDILRGEAGNDTLDGGEGFDWASYFTAPSGVTVNLDAGTATGGDGNDTLPAIESVIGSVYADTIYGDSGQNDISGNGGNDTLWGGAGDDDLSGDAGNDMLVQCA